MDGVTTDEDIYIVDVAITDNGDGTLKAEPKRVLGDKDKGEIKLPLIKRSLPINIRQKELH